MCVYNGILLSHKKNEFLPFAGTRMEPESIMISEISQTEKRQILHDFTCMWNLKKMNKQTNKQTKPEIDS